MDNLGKTLPEAISSSGVSVGYAKEPMKHWYVFRASYGRENKAFDFFVETGTYAYVAKRYAWKYYNGKKRRVLESLIPNLVFAYTTRNKADEYVKDTLELSFLSFYYNHFEVNNDRKNPPLTISCQEMENFIKMTYNKSEHLQFVDSSHIHYKSGDIVRVVDGLFKGVEGKVARVAGQQRVVVSLSNIGFISSAYIPSAFIERL